MRRRRLHLESEKRCSRRLWRCIELASPFGRDFLQTEAGSSRKRIEKRLSQRFSWTGFSSAGFQKQANRFWLATFARETRQADKKQRLEQKETGQKSTLLKSYAFRHPSVSENQDSSGPASCIVKVRRRLFTGSIVRCQ